MEVLRKQLRQELAHVEAKVLQERMFTIPVATVQARFYPLLRRRMDVLMKMLLQAYATGAFSEARELVDILLVEELFLRDVTEQMVRSRLVEQGERLQLTAKGQEQLQSGIYEEQLPEAEAVLTYSAVHRAFLAEDVEALEEWDELPEPLPYIELEETTSLPETEAIRALNELYEEAEEPLVVTELERLSLVQLYDIPCLVFVCYDEARDHLFAKVHNMLTNRWDAEVEQLLAEQERVRWREELLGQK